MLAIYEGMGLVKLDKDSNVIWSSDLKAHHDLEVQNDGDIYVLTRKAHRVPRIDASAPILEDFVSILNSDGKLKAELSLLEAFENSRFANLVHDSLASDNGDIFHTNTVAVLDGRFAKRDRAFEHGNLLTSMNRMGVVAVVSVRLGQVVWVRRTAAVGQHDPKFLRNGNMLLFSNNMNTDSSVVEEFNPVGGEVHWTHRGTQEHPFYSKYLGAAERLANGNTLITESDGGRAFEVTRGGETVWEFYNPNRSGSEGEYIATLPELIRLPRDYPIGWASQPPPTAP
ncbi:MAG: aryl-sulfate sulfotransferase [Deltaproteobacteria bacterium]|nr:aryl-sulfate sulfotransferase [Deltaproteobacteria bacterium]